MIRVDSITIQEFRGIRSLTLKPEGKAYAVCGPNGTGKSGIVDALEFALTGKISRLSGEGRGDISLKVHGPHVDCRDAPERAEVAVEITIPSLKKKATVVRGIKAPGSKRVTPKDPEVLAVLATIESRADFVLSRRELIKYVLATPGDRAAEVQALLRLEEIEKVRGGLQKIANAAAKLAAAFESQETAASAALCQALGIAALDDGEVLTAVNAKRALLELPPIHALTATTSWKDGLVATAATGGARVSKPQAQADIEAARALAAEIARDSMRAEVAAAREALTALATDPRVTTGLAREEFLSKGLELLDAECPFCDTEWDPAKLRAHVERTLEELRSVAAKRDACERRLAPLVEKLRTMRVSLAGLREHGQRAAPPQAMPEIQAHVDRLGAAEKAIAAFLPLEATRSALDHLSALPAGAQAEIDALAAHVADLPEPSHRDAARDWLTVAEERLDNWRDARRKREAAAERAAHARLVSDTYSATSDRTLAAMYEKVQSDFSRLYAAINQEDERNFAAKLVPSLGKLGFDVDFYGRGFFPPGAYHSEGHQDGMGLCLYLALMRYLYGADFTFAVLDDVLMSVDSGHRREVCRLLRKEFPDTQFVLTTHDPIWLKHMKSEGVVAGKAAITFRKWDVDGGPVEWDERDVWQEIEGYLDKNDVRGAAALLRHYLEHESAELCHRLRARVEFRGDAQHDLGALLPAAVGRLQELYGKGKAAANSWNQKEQVAAIAVRSDTFGAAAAKSQCDRWQINTAVHYNSWDTLVKQDFRPVVEAYRALLDAFRCSECHAFLWLSPEKGDAEALRCECTAVNINLRPSSGSGAPGSKTARPVSAPQPPSDVPAVRPAPARPRAVRGARAGKRDGG